MSSETNTLCFSNLSALDDKTIGITSGQSDSCFENVLLIKTEVNEAKLGTVEQMKNEDVLSNMPMEEVSIKQEYKDTEEHRLENVFADEIKIEEHELREIISEKPKENFQSYECSAQSEEMTIKEELNPNSLGDLWSNFFQETARDTELRSPSAPCIPKKSYKDKKFKCSYCQYQTMQNKRLETHHLHYHKIEELWDQNGTTDENNEAPCIPEKSYKDKKFKCSYCRYQTMQNKRLETHHLHYHKIEELSYQNGTTDEDNEEDVEMYKCVKCEFKTKYRNSIKNHVKLHREKKLIELKCDSCKFRTYRKTNLRKHMHFHKQYKDPLSRYKCDKCSYRTSRSAKLAGHKLKHKKPDEIEMLKCDECCFQTRYRASVKSHKCYHKNKNTEVHRCTKCDYQTTGAFDIRKHLLVHEPDELIFTLTKSTQ